MALVVPICEFLIREHCYRPITGSSLFVGRQTVPLTPELHERLLSRHGLRNAYAGPIELDNETRYSEGKGYITDRYFMRSIGVDQFHALDVTDYEGADIVHDLGYPVGDEHRQKFDFIYNGGCFDNMFNPGVAMMSLSKMLKPGGRMICLESASSFAALPYLIFSPGWFHDFFVMNRYADCKVYIGSFIDGYKLWHGPWDMSYVNVPANAVGGPPEPQPGSYLLIVVVAEKGKDSTDDVQPVQSVYRIGDTINAAYNVRQVALLSNPRPIVTDGRSLSRPFTDYLVPVGELGKDLT
jgi:SAM-dependent methyltransferase